MSVPERIYISASDYLSGIWNSDMDEALWSVEYIRADLAQQMPDDVRGILEEALSSWLYEDAGLMTKEERRHRRVEWDKATAWLDSQRDADVSGDAPVPNWDDAPEWAQWAFLVMYTGHKFLEFRWKFTDILPERDKEWKCYVTPYDAMYYIGPTVDLPIGIDWRTTLRRRPEAENYKQEGIN